MKLINIKLDNEGIKEVIKLNHISPNYIFNKIIIQALKQELKENKSDSIERALRSLYIYNIKINEALKSDILPTI